jgi:hypothetical protein
MNTPNKIFDMYLILVRVPYKKQYSAEMRNQGVD